MGRIGYIWTISVNIYNEYLPRKSEMLRLSAGDATMAEHNHLMDEEAYSKYLESQKEDEEWVFTRRMFYNYIFVWVIGTKESTVIAKFMEYLFNPIKAPIKLRLPRKNT